MAKAQYRPPFVLIALTLYGGLHLVAICYARGRFAPQAAAAPRYYMDLCLLFVGFIWAAALVLTMVGLGRFQKIVVVALSASILTIFLLGQAATARDELHKAPFRKMGFDRMRSLTLSGVSTREQAAELQAPLPVVKEGIAAQRRLGLGPFRTIACGHPMLLDGWFPDAGDAVWMGQQASGVFRNCNGVLTVKVSLPANFAERTLMVAVDGGGVASHVLRPGESLEIRLALPPTQRYVTITLSVNRTTRPADLTRGVGDMRSLGLFVNAITS
jgi:hypothetical protein